MTDESGQVVADGLAPGEYKLHEVTAPEGYIINTLPISFTIDEEAEGEPAAFDLEAMVNYKGSVEWQKITEDGEPLTGAEFKVFNQNQELVTTVNSDENGMVQISELAPGTYTVQETSTIEGYILNSETFDFTIENEYMGKPEPLILDQFKNYQGKVQLIKMTDSNEPLAGAVFDLLRDDEVIESGLTTDENGQVYVERLIPGNYSFVETSAPGGFILNTQPLDFEIKSEIKGEPAVLRVGDFVNYRGNVELEKVDIQGNPLAGATFEVRDSKGNIVRKNVTSDNDGKVLVEHLAPGEYVMNEVQAPVGYLINSTTLQFTVDTESIGKPDTIQLGQFFNYQGDLEILKLNEDKELLENAVFDIFDEEGNKVAQNLSTNQNGSILLSELAPGNYNIVETKAPDGYQLDNKTYSVTIPNTSEGKPEQVSIEITNKRVIVNQESSDINGSLPQMNTSSYQLIIALVAIGLIVLGITLFRKNQEN
ncbi:MSCRAMM family protein [Marinilactibacillus sp. 15R]|uniref:MSCRAMM family protein n=2 Tax=Marinilactibacillus TaxID=191769 RepID=UPI000B899EB1|nr:SpaA isopeptide-forming pilin-related protein [Marinilactibacillus sp. 15R]